MSCLDFKTGTFYIEFLGHTVKVIREADSQTEFFPDSKEFENSGLREKTYEKIEWIDECSYRIKYDETKMELTDSEKALNSENGILIEMKSVEDKCMAYDSTGTLNGKPFRVSLKMCKQQ
jgi:hypothetical protein